MMDIVSKSHSFCERDHRFAEPRIRIVKHESYESTCTYCMIAEGCEEARQDGWKWQRQEKEAGGQVCSGLHPPRGGWHHGCHQLCMYSLQSFKHTLLQNKLLSIKAVVYPK